MKARISLIIAAAFISVAASAQIGAPYIHDPSTIAECDGKYYTFGTGGGGLISEDGPAAEPHLTPSRLATVIW